VCCLSGQVTPVQLSFNVRLGVMRIALCLIDSIDAQLPGEHASRQLLAKYLTMEHARSLLLHYAQTTAEEAIHLVPCAIRLVAVAAKLLALGAAGAGPAAGKRGKKAALNTAAAAGPTAADLAVLLDEVYCPAWAAITDERARGVLAKAAVAMYCDAGHAVSAAFFVTGVLSTQLYMSVCNEQAALVAVVTASLESEVRGAAAAGRGKGRKAQPSAPVASTALMTPAAALDLLSACDSEAFTQTAILPVHCYSSVM
jgi:hypothetical protein